MPWQRHTVSWRVHRDRFPVDPDVRTTPFAVDPSGWYPSEPPIQRLPDKAHRPEARSGLIEKENQLYLLQC